MVLDEGQRTPQITFALKRIVETESRYRKTPRPVCAYGSSDIFTTGKAYDSLAGRVMTLRLRPLSAAEIA